jgi:ribosomal protein L4
MKAIVLNKDGKEGKTIELPSCFSEKIREDIIKKVFEAVRFNEKHNYGNYKLAGKEVSASGRVKHRRRK